MALGLAIFRLCQLATGAFRASIIRGRAQRLINELSGQFPAAARGLEGSLGGQCPSTLS